MRNTELIVRGWGVLPVTYKALMRNPRREAGDVRRAREARLALLASR